MSVQSDLEKSMEEEALAAAVYRGRAASARADGDNISARLWDHIAEEEDNHYSEFSDRTVVVQAQTQPEHEATYRKTTLIGIGEIQEIHTKLPGGGGITGIYGMRQESRPFPQTYGDWVDLAEDIKEKSGNDPAYNATVNYQLQTISGEGVNETPEAVANAKRWLVQKAGELGIG